MKVTLYEIPLNNHGCTGESVTVEIIDEKTGKIIAGDSCSSCWQVGHDKNESPIAIGAIVQLPESFRPVVVWDERNVQEAGNGMPVTWNNARLSAGYSHNELVDDSDNPQPDTSLCRPQDLVIVALPEAA